MELVTVWNGGVPAGRIPVEGGRDKDGRVLYHAVGRVADGGRWPMMGVAAEHFVSWPSSPLFRCDGMWNVLRVALSSFVIWAKCTSWRGGTSCCG